MNRVRVIRATLGLSQRDLEAMSGVSQAAISRYEKGESDIASESIVQLCQALDCSADYLLGRIDDPRPYHQGEAINAFEHALLKAWRARDLWAVLRLLVGDAQPDG